MAIIKVTKDYIARILQETADRLAGIPHVPKSLYELVQYFRREGPINFTYHQEEGVLVAVSTNFRYGSIVTSGKNSSELDTNIKDAILASFDLPSAYAKKVQLYKVGEQKTEYALA
ncbi:MAG: hypothetical protein AAB870_04060 [Patescibacteria group bacterium]